MPLEDEFCDILKKSRMGQGLSVSDVARMTGLPSADVTSGPNRIETIFARLMLDDDGAELAELACQIEEFGADAAILPGALGVLHIDAVGRGVLRDHQQFLDAGSDQLLGFAQHVAGGARCEIADGFKSQPSKRNHLA